MRKRNVRHRFDFLDFENTQISLPLMVPIQRIMIGTQIFRQYLCVDRSIEHPAQRNSIHHAAVNGEAHDSSCKLIHHDQNPLSSQYWVLPSLVVGDITISNLATKRYSRI